MLHALSNLNKNLYSVTGGGNPSSKAVLVFFNSFTIFYICCVVISGKEFASAPPPDKEKFDTASEILLFCSFKTIDSLKRDSK
jgi:hypothetical protein